MEKSKSKGWLLGAAAAAIACILQVIGLIRYVRRLPDDCVGITLYVITVAAFSLVAVVFLIRWKKEKTKRSKQRPAG